MKDMLVESVMTTQLVTARESAPFKDLVRLMAEHGISGLPIVDDDGRPVGVVSEADTLAKQEYQGGTRQRPLLGRRRRRAWRKASGLTARDLMTAPAVTIDEKQPVTSAARVLAEKNIRRLCVVNLVGELVGVVSRRDVIGTFLRADADIKTDVEEQVFRRGMWMFPGTMRVAIANGVATLDGQVERRTTAEVAGQLTRSVPGVVSVTNRTRYEIDDTIAV